MTTRAMHEATCLIMAALAGQGEHAGGIIARVHDMSDGRVRLRTGTLFAVLDKLRTDNLVSIERDEVVGGRRRRYYRLLPGGSVTLAEPGCRAPHPDLRISDSDRDAAVSALSEHFAQGRLTADELHARLGLALAAATRRDIARATADLPWHRGWPEGGVGGDLPGHQARPDAEAP
jgi:PadR family transcriptional regulator, regulatory protein PadR